MTQNETPDSIYDFFDHLDPGGLGEEDCEIHFGCNCVIEKGKMAAQMLRDIQTMLGGPAPAKAPDAEASDPETDDVVLVEKPGEITELKILPRKGGKKATPASTTNNHLEEELLEAEVENDRLVVHNSELNEENKRMREKIRSLYKQIERLYARSEMRTVLEKLDSGIAQDEAEEKAVEEATEEETASVEEAEEAPEESPEESEDVEQADEGAEEEAAQEDSSDEGEESEEEELAQVISPEDLIDEREAAGRFVEPESEEEAEEDSETPVETPEGKKA